MATEVNEREDDYSSDEKLLKRKTIQGTTTSSRFTVKGLRDVAENTEGKTGRGSDNRGRLS